MSIRRSFRYSRSFRDTFLTVFCSWPTTPWLWRELRQPLSSGKTDLPTGTHSGPRSIRGAQVRGGGRRSASEIVIMAAGQVSSWVKVFRSKGQPSRFAARAPSSAYNLDVGGRFEDDDNVRGRSVWRLHPHETIPWHQKLAPIHHAVGDLARSI
jgi:hypothetical protein